MKALDHDKFDIYQNCIHAHIYDKSLCKNFILLIGNGNGNGVGYGYVN